MKRIILLLAASALTGCAGIENGIDTMNIALSPVGQNYTPVQSARLTEPCGCVPTIQRASGNNPIDDVGRMYADGFGMVGYASFGGKMNLNRFSIEAQAKRAGASTVLVSAKYAGSVQGIMPFSLPTSSTTVVNGTASAYGSGGYATGQYNGTATTYGTSTALVPYSVAQYDQAALFFAPLAHRGIGVAGQNPSADDARRIGTQQAMRVFSVRRGSPAFVADILPGDFILTIDGKPIYDAATFDSAQAAAAGRPVPVRIWRDGGVITKTITPW